MRWAYKSAGALVKKEASVNVEQIRLDPDPYEPYRLSQGFRVGDFLFVSGNRLVKPSPCFELPPRVGFLNPSSISSAIGDFDLMSDPGTDKLNSLRRGGFIAPI